MHSYGYLQLPLTCYSLMSDVCSRETGYFHWTEKSSKFGTGLVWSVYLF